MFYQYYSIFEKTYLSSDPETTLDWSQDFDLSETISGIIFFLATEFDLGLSLKLKNGLSLRFLRLRPLPATGLKGCVLRLLQLLFFCYEYITLVALTILPAGYRGQVAPL